MLDSSNQVTQSSLSRDWTAYYSAVEGRPPRDTLLNALDQFKAESIASGFAVDLGCGDGRDTVELLRRGWQVLAIDGEPEAIARLHDRFQHNQHNLLTRIDCFETLTLPVSVDLINASFCLPFCPPEHFSTLWQTMVRSLRQGGRFCGQLIGELDSWSTYPNVNYHTRHQIDTLLEPFNVELLTEESHPGKTAVGEEKYWHLFHIVAQKR